MPRAAPATADTKRVMQLLAGDGGAQLNEKDKNGDITKMWVSRQGAQVENGWTALLWWASLKGHTEVVRLLLVLCAILTGLGGPCFVTYSAEPWPIAEPGRAPPR